MSRLATHSLVYLASNVLTAALPFALLPILTRYLSPAEYGQVATFQALLNVATLLIGMNLSGAASVQKFKIDDVALRRYLGTCLLINLSAALIGAVGLAFAGPAMAHMLDLPRAWLYVALAGGLAGGVYAYRLILWQVEGQPIAYGAFNLTLSVVNVTVSLLLVVGANEGGNGRVAGIGLATVIMGLFAADLLRRSRAVSLQWDAAAGRNALLFSLPLVPHALAGMAMSQADRFLIGQQLGLSEAGVYAVSMQLAAPLIMVADGFNRAYVPWLYRRLSAGQTDAAITLSALGAILVFVATFIVIGLTRLFLPVLLGEKFALAGDLLIWLAPGVAASAAYYMFVNFIFYAEKTATIPLVTVTAATAYVTVGLAAVQSYGSHGLATVYSSTNALQTLAIFMLCNRLYPLPWFKLETYRRGFRSLRGQPTPQQKSEKSREH